MATERHDKSYRNRPDYQLMLHGIFLDTMKYSLWLKGQWEAEFEVHSYESLADVLSDFIACHEIPFEDIEAIKPVGPVNYHEIVQNKRIDESMKRITGPIPDPGFDVA